MEELLESIIEWLRENHLEAVRGITVYGGFMLLIGKIVTKVRKWKNPLAKGKKVPRKKLLLKSPNSKRSQ